MKDFYVYVYLDPRKPGQFTYGELSFEFEPFYIGKGKDRRWKRHLNEAKNGKNQYRHHKIRSIWGSGQEPVILKLNQGISESEAHDIETAYIKLIGRDVLTNLTDGGDGTSGRHVGPESRLKARESHIDLWTDEKRKRQSDIVKSGMTDEVIKKRVETRLQNDNYGHDDETKEKLSDASKSLWQDPAFRNKVLNARAQALAEGRGKRKSSLTYKEKRAKANEAKRARRQKRKNGL